MAALTLQPPATCFSIFATNKIAIMSDKKDKDNPSFFKGEFSFVNKDAGNIDSKDHSAAVSWHVMNRYERWKKQEQAKQLRASAIVPVGPSSPHQSTTSVLQASLVTPKRRHISHLPQNTTSVPRSPFGNGPWLADHSLPVGFSGPSQDPGSGVPPTSATSASSTPSSNFEDPFSVLGYSDATLTMPAPEQIEVDPDATTSLVSRVLTFGYEYLIPQTWPTETGKPQWAYEIARSWEDAAALTQDQFYSNAHLAFVATALADTQGDNGMAQQAQAFKAHAISELRQRVAGKGLQNLHTLKAILKLFASETIVDNTAVARVHLKLLRNLVTAAGGILILDSWFREDLLSCDCYFALKYGTRPLFPAQEWTPGSLSQQWNAKLTSAGIHGDHAANVDNAVDHPIMRSIFTDVRELLRVEEYLEAHEVPFDDQLLRWRQLRKYDCISRLGDHYINLTIYPHLYSNPNIQSSTTLAAALLINMVLGCPEPCRYGVKLLDDLKKKLEGTENADESPDHKRLRLWAAYVGSLGEAVHPIDNKTWFRDRVRKTTKEMGLADWEKDEKIFKRLLYSRTLYEEIENGRSYRQEDFRKGLYGACGTSWRDPLMPSDSSPGDSTYGEGSLTTAGKRRTET